MCSTRKLRRLTRLITGGYCWVACGHLHVDTSSQLLWPDRYIYLKKTTELPLFLCGVVLIGHSLSRGLMHRCKPGGTEHIRRCWHAFVRIFGTEHIVKDCSSKLTNASSTDATWTLNPLCPRWLLFGGAPSSRVFGKKGCRYDATVLKDQDYACLHHLK